MDSYNIIWQEGAQQLDNFSKWRPITADHHEEDHAQWPSEGEDEHYDWEEEEDENRVLEWEPTGTDHWGQYAGLEEGGRQSPPAALGSAAGHQRRVFTQPAESRSFFEVRKPLGTLRFRT